MLVYNVYWINLGKSVLMVAFSVALLGQWLLRRVRRSMFCCPSLATFKRGIASRPLETCLLPEDKLTVAPKGTEVHLFWLEKALAQGHVMDS